MCGISLTHDTIIIAQLYFLLSHWLFISCGNIKVSLGTYKNSVWPYSFSARPWVIDNPDIISNHKYSFHRSQSKFQTEILFPFPSWDLLRLEACNKGRPEGWPVSLFLHFLLLLRALFLLALGVQLQSPPSRKLSS